MNEVIEHLAELIKTHTNDETTVTRPDEEDKKNMLSILKELLSIKRKELSAYNMLFCQVAHSFGDEEIKLIDSLRSECKGNIDSLEELRSAMKSITY